MSCFKAWWTIDFLQFVFSEMFSLDPGSYLELVYHSLLLYMGVFLYLQSGSNSNYISPCVMKHQWPTAVGLLLSLVDMSMFAPALIL